MCLSGSVSHQAVYLFACLFFSARLSVFCLSVGLHHAVCLLCVYLPDCRLTACLLLLSSACLPVFALCLLPVYLSDCCWCYMCCHLLSVFCHCCLLRVCLLSIFWCLPIRLLSVLYVSVLYVPSSVVCLLSLLPSACLSAVHLLVSTCQIAVCPVRVRPVRAVICCLSSVIVVFCVSVFCVSDYYLSYTFLSCTRRHLLSVFCHCCLLRVCLCCPSSACLPVRLLLVLYSPSSVVCLLSLQPSACLSVFAVCLAYPFWFSVRQVIHSDFLAVSVCFLSVGLSMSGFLSVVLPMSFFSLSFNFLLLFWLLFCYACLFSVSVDLPTGLSISA